MKLLFLGDFFYNYNYIKDDIINISKWIRKNGYKVILNLEGSLSNCGEPIDKRGRVLSQSHITIEVLKQLNVIGVCLANNHIMDYGEEALKRTLEILDDNNILHTGAGINIVEALKPIKMQVDNEVVIIQNFGWDVEETVYATENSAGCAPRDIDLILKKTKKLREKNPTANIINIYHWGFEFNLLPMPFDVKLAHDSIDYGCDLIIGHHPHNMQPFEKYKNKYIFYSLGNFYFSTRRDYFSNKFFPNKISNRCDYGAMVVFDVFNKEISYEHLVYYDVKNKSSIIIKENLDILEDITDQDLFSKDYIKKVREKSLNINPILTLNERENKRKLGILGHIYMISGCFKNIRNNVIGRKFHAMLKSIYIHILRR